MGRIKTARTKRATYDLMDAYGDKFTDNFAKNKEIIKEYADIPSRKLANVIAGYVTRLVRSKAK